MTTVKDLKNEISWQRDPAGGIPSPKALYESETEIVLADDFGEKMDQELRVYANGLVYYRHGKRRTAFRLHDVNDNYFSNLDPIASSDLSESEASVPWNFHLMMVGEDRIFANSEATKNKHIFSLEVDEEHPELDIEDTECVDPLQKIINEEKMDIVYSLLTEKQKLVFEMFFEQKMKQVEIATILGKNKSSISRMLENALETLRKHKNEIF